MIWQALAMIGIGGSGLAIALFPALLPTIARLIRTVPPLWLAIALCGAVAAFCWHGWAKDHARLGDEKKAHRANVTALIDAGNRATAAQAALIAAINKKNREAKETADAKLPVESDRAYAVARDYIRLHRAPSCPSGTGKADSASAAADTQVAGGTSATAVLVSEADVMICTANTTRLLNARDWALDLAK